MEEEMIALGYDDVTLIPTTPSYLEHRSDADTSQIFPNTVHHTDTGEYGHAYTLKLPFITAPMADVTNGHMAEVITKYGVFAFIHRFQPIKDQVREYEQSKIMDDTAYSHAANLSIMFRPNPAVGCAIGVTEDWEERFEALWNVGCFTFVLDTANGANDRVAKVIANLRGRSYGKYLYLVAGNVGSSQTFKWLEDYTIDAIRVGIAGGNVCDTRTETGVYTPAISAIFDAAKVRKTAKIIADGGIRSPSDACKALAAGADLVMMGSSFAGSDESPGKVILMDGKKYKILRGSASYSTQESIGKEPIYVEGDETLVPYQGRVEKVVERFKNGLLSSMSYFNSRTLDEYRQNVTIVRVR